MEEKIGIGIVGTGGIGKIHTWALMRNKNCHVIAACSVNEDELEQFKQGIWEKTPYTGEKIKPKYPVENVYTNYKKLIQNKKVDAVFVCVPNALHFEISSEVLKNGKHCFVEKPMCISTKQAKELIDISEKNNLTLQVGHVWRFHKDIQKAKELISKGLIGDIVKVKAYSIHVLWQPKGWFTKPELSGGGSLVDMGVHAIDTVRFLLNGVNYNSVYADIKTRYGNYNVDDTDILFLKTQNDIPVLIESGWSQVYADGPEASVQIFGTKGYIRVFPTQIKIFLGNRNNYGTFLPEETESHDTLMTFTRQVDNFVDSVRGKESPLCSGKDGAHVVEVCEAAYSSSEKGEVVRIPCSQSDCERKRY
ncbi:MAG: hypothetical protein DRP50_01515 [Thermotoga sp.]|nr:MAG: hypothetical protein DRP50_01515 [Thermotoga sp.]